jgi:ethanolamine utilization protein EutA
MHDDYKHDHLSEADRREMAEYIWRQETVQLNTVGIDIGSSTSHLLFARVTLQRHVHGLSSRFTVTDREVVWRSPIMLTPFLQEGTIDAGQLGKFIRDAYRQAGYKREDIDSGAVILTGEAIKRRNARAIDELFAQEAGTFVCATAGHKLESTLAAHGSGAVKLSKDRGECFLHIDIGGGTTKMALIDSGRVCGVSAFAVGGRLLATDEAGNWTRVDKAAQLAADDLGVKTDRQTLADPEVRRRIARRLAQVAVDHIGGGELDRLGMLLQLTEKLPREATPSAFCISGGVSEYLFGREDKDYGDIAKMLAQEIREQLNERTDLQMIDPGQGIRATVIGASQFTVQVSGKTIYLPDPAALPVHNVPVVRVDADLSGDIESQAVAESIRAGLRRLDLTPEACLAVAFTWQGDPEFRRLEAMGQGIVAATAPEGRRDAPLLLMIDGDVGGTLGRLLEKELGLPGSLISVDGVQLQELDFVDVGEMITPPGVVPVVIKSLLFS